MATAKMKHRFIFTFRPPHGLDRGFLASGDPMPTNQTITPQWDDYRRRFWECLITPS
jgi:hypothetical protein